MTNPPHSNRALAAIWRVRLDKAEASYELAVAEFRRSTEEYRSREASDGDFALRRAIAAEDSARERYIQVLKVFTELLVNGTAPPED